MFRGEKMKKNNFTRISGVLAVLILVAFLILYPNTGKIGVTRGLYIATEIIIPSLFPFTFCVLFIMRSGILRFLKKIEVIPRILFSQTGNEFAVFVLSLIGGYPVGARLIKELYETNATDRKRAEILLCCCVNAGPAFTVIAVGNGLFASSQVGYILLASSVAASVLIAFICGFLLKPADTRLQKNMQPIPDTADNFVTSAADAADSVFSICVFVVLFSVLTAYIDAFSKEIRFLKFVGFFAEITSALTRTRNIYFISFLLGFSGLCVWLQILSSVGDIKLNPIPFVLSRFLHGALSTLFTFIGVKVFKPALNTISNNVNFGGSLFVSSAALALALLSMGILFCISVFGKKSSGSFLKDML